MVCMDVLFPGMTALRDPACCLLCPEVEQRRDRAGLGSGTTHRAAEHCRQTGQTLALLGFCCHSFQPTTNHINLHSQHFFLCLVVF